MSNATERAVLERMDAPVIAWLIDHGYVADDCGILNVKNYHWREGVRLAKDAQYGVKQVPVPEMRRVRERL